MSDVASVIAALVRGGVDPDLIGQVAAMAVAQATSVDVQAERRRARDRDRKAAKPIPRNPRNSAERTETLPLPPETEVSPKPLSRTQTTNPIQLPPIVPRSATKSKPTKGSFAKFWAAYPLKVGKGKAEPAYCRAWGRCETSDPEGEILGGLARCAPLFEPEFTPYPATWLNRDGWLDQMVPDTPDGGGRVVIDLARIDADRARIRAQHEAEEHAA